MPRSSGNEIIRDVLETDVYNCSQINAILTLYPNVWAWYILKDRDRSSYPKGFAGLVKEKFQDLRSLRCDPSLRAFLQTKWGFLAQEFFDWLNKYKFVPEYIEIWQDDQGRLDGKILGPWVDTVFHEQIVMAVISQTRNEELNFLPDDNWLDTLLSIIHNLRYGDLQVRRFSLKVSEFGLRRRAYNWMHDQVNEYLIKYGGDMYVGSSSPYHSQKSGQSPKGTVGHQWTLFHAALHDVEHANMAALTAWRAVYGDNLGTALTDTFTSDFFWATLTPGMARLIKSYRQDSGDPFHWTNHTLSYLTHSSVNIDPSTITVMYTDSLSDQKAIEINTYASQWFKTAFGIGGYFTNNKNFFSKTPAYKPLNVVVKPYAFSFDYGQSWTKVAKVPDAAGKNIGDSSVVAEYKQVIAKYPFLY